MIYKILAEYIQENIPGCSFVGIEENTGELLVSFDHEEDERKREATTLLLDKFEEVKRVIIVERLSIKKATEMVDDLNKALDAPKEEKKPDLLDIGSF